ncbi:MAG: LysE family translocator [Pseudomonadota bacterium]
MNLWLFIPACFALNLAFGPNNLLALTHGAQRGVGFAVIAGLGRLAAFVPMIALAGLGLGLLLSASAAVFTAVKVLGAAYLIWIGIRLLRTASSTAEAPPVPPLAPALRREALVALGNPKAILIFAAFFPQFVQPDAYASSYAVLGGLFLVLELGAIAVYAAAGRIAARAGRVPLHWLSRASGAGMILFGMLMLLTRRPAA